MEKLKYACNGKWLESKTDKWMDVYDPSKGEVIAQAPCCTMEEIQAVLDAAQEAYKSWSKTPIIRRTQILFNFRDLVVKHMEELTKTVAREHGVAQGFALAAQCGRSFDVFTIIGDGELQEGLPWEAVMFAAFKRLDNFCVLLDKNEGQLDNPKSLHYPMNNLDRVFESFGWDGRDVDGTNYEPVLDVLMAFKYGPRNGRPKLIICNCQKGEGGFSSFMVGHKVEFTDALVEQEMKQQEIRWEARVEDLGALIASAESNAAAAICAYAVSLGKKMGLKVSYNAGGKLWKGTGVWFISGS
jgi:hypothetical protein